MEKYKQDYVIQEEDLSVEQLNKMQENAENPMCVCSHRFYSHNLSSLDYRKAPIQFCCITGCDCQKFLDEEIAEQQNLRMF